MSDSQNWYFTAETNAKGYTYNQGRTKPNGTRCASVPTVSIAAMSADCTMTAVSCPAKHSLSNFLSTQASRFFMAPTSVWSMKRPIAVISQSGRDRIEILKKP